MAAQSTTARPRNGTDTRPDPLAAAIAYEEEIATEAAVIRGDQTTLTPELLAELLPLLKKPIPAGFIKSVGKVTGKPYDSTGVSSVQVQIERMDNVLTPLWWREDHEYMEQGKLCYVTVFIGNLGVPPMVARSSMGGVDRASTVGNLYKGSYTNAAKVAIARVGPGHEVYLGATDLDPDVHEQAATHQSQPAAQSAAGQVSEDTPITRTLANEIVDAAWVWELQDKLPLAIAHVTDGDPGDLSDRKTAVNVVGQLNIGQATKVKRWIDRRAQEKADRGEQTTLDKKEAKGA